MIRNFGLRTPPCTADNPSITTTEGLSSEGVGSYWTFATGCRVDHANILLRQICNTPKVQYTLTPNQHVGAWAVSFMPQWIAREYLARRGTARFPTKLDPMGCRIIECCFDGGAVGDYEGLMPNQ